MAAPVCLSVSGLKKARQPNKHTGLGFGGSRLQGSRVLHLDLRHDRTSGTLCDRFGRLGKPGNRTLEASPHLSAALERSR